MNKILDYSAEFLPAWIRCDGEASDVVISSRIRLARNLKGLPFPGQANQEQLATINDALGQALQKKASFGPLILFEMADLAPAERIVLVEKHLCSPQFIEAPQQRLLAVNEEQTVSLMVNEEDHLRIQTMTPGLAVDSAWNLAEQVDDFLEDSLELAFDEAYGYLTACLTNVGTGLRASVMLHLPGLAMADQVKKVLTAMAHIGLSIRGLYGEGTESVGDIYQISNSVTLGRSEPELIANLTGACRQVIEQERRVRDDLQKKASLQLADRIGRSYGILTQAKLLTASEALQYLSDVKLGVELGILEQLNKTVIKELFFLTRPALLQRLAGRELNPAGRDQQRAAVIREYLTK